MRLPFPQILQGSHWCGMAARLMLMMVIGATLVPVLLRRTRMAAMPKVPSSSLIRDSNQK